MYTGFFKDMSTRDMFGVSSQPIHSPPPDDRDTQIRTGSTDLELGAFHRGLLTGDNSWQCFAQFLWQQPFLYQAAANPRGLR